VVKAKQRVQLQKNPATRIPTGTEGSSVCFSTLQLVKWLPARNGRVQVERRHLSLRVVYCVCSRLLFFVTVLAWDNCLFMSE